MRWPYKKNRKDELRVVSCKVGVESLIPSSNQSPSISAVVLIDNDRGYYCFDN